MRPSEKHYPFPNVPLPFIFGHHRLVRRLGEGGMGRVFEAERTGGTTTFQVAVKVPQWNLLDALKDRVPELHAEVERVARLPSHDGLVKVTDAGTHQGIPWMEMELLKGAALDAWPEIPKAADVLRWAVTLADVLVHLERQGVVHRDLKPSNLWITQQGNLKVLDFGVARGAAVTGVLTTATAGVGSLAYMAPEQLQGRVGVASDVWAFGATFYEVVTRERCFPGDEMGQVMAGVLTHQALSKERVARVDALVPGFGGLLARCLLRDPVQRIGAADLHEHLAALPVPYTTFSFPRMPTPTMPSPEPSPKPPPLVRPPRPVPKPVRPVKVPPAEEEPRGDGRLHVAGALALAVSAVWLHAEVDPEELGFFVLFMGGLVWLAAVASRRGRVWGWGRRLTRWRLAYSGLAAVITCLFGESYQGVLDEGFAVSLLACTMTFVWMDAWVTVHLGPMLLTWANIFRPTPTLDVQGWVIRWMTSLAGWGTSIFTSFFLVGITYESSPDSPLSDILFWYIFTSGAGVLVLWWDLASRRVRHMGLEPGLDTLMTAMVWLFPPLGLIPAGRASER